MSALKANKTRVSNDFRVKQQIGNLGLSLTEKISSTLEKDALPGVSAH